MIAYDLTCGNGHTFEGWFEDSTAFALAPWKAELLGYVGGDELVLGRWEEVKAKERDASPRSAAARRPNEPAAGAIDQQQPDESEASRLNKPHAARSE